MSSFLTRWYCFFHRAHQLHLHVRTDSTADYHIDILSIIFRIGSRNGCQEIIWHKNSSRIKSSVWTPVFTRTVGPTLIFLRNWFILQPARVERTTETFKWRPLPVVKRLPYSAMDSLLLSSPKWSHIPFPYRHQTFKNRLMLPINDPNSPSYIFTNHYALITFGWSAFTQHKPLSSMLFWSLQNACIADKVSH